MRQDSPGFQGRPVMRSIIVSDFASVSGGAAKVAIESARGLAEAGCEVLFVAAIGPVSPVLDHPLIRVETIGAAEVWSVRNPLRAAAQGVWNLAAFDRIAAIAARERGRETVIHLHQWTKAFSPAAIGAAAQSGLPVFITMHDYFSFCPEGAYFDFRAGHACDRKPMSAACMTANCDRKSYAHKLVRVARQWRSDQTMAQAKNLTFLHVTDFARRFAEPHLPRHARHATVENMMEAARRPAVDPARNAHVLFLGRFTVEKAPHLLAEAAARANVPVGFIGEGPMRDAIAKANPAAEIHPWIPADKALDAMARARALALPSMWFEPGPLVIAEARSLGLPTVLSRTTGPASWIRDGEDGIIVEPGDVDGLTRALALLQDDHVATRMGFSAYNAYWRDPLTTKRHVQRTLALYETAHEWMNAPHALAS
jgi:glycosyltransferase involved in cell wall biosynthesis